MTTAIYHATVLKQIDDDIYSLRIKHYSGYIISEFNLSSFLNGVILNQNDKIILHFIYHDDGVYCQVCKNSNENEFSVLNNFDNLTI